MADGKEGTQCFEFTCSGNGNNNGCPEKEPNCEDTLDGFGPFCYFCQNDEVDENKVDTGCNKHGK